MTYLGTHVSRESNHRKVVDNDKASDAQWLSLSHKTWSHVDKDQVGGDDQQRRFRSAQPKQPSAAWIWNHNIIPSYHVSEWVSRFLTAHTTMNHNLYQPGKHWWVFESGSSSLSWNMLVAAEEALPQTAFWFWVGGETFPKSSRPHRDRQAELFRQQIVCAQA